MVQITTVDASTIEKMVHKLDELSKQSTVIDRRVRANEFMKLLSIEKDKFYGMIKCGEIENPIRLSPKDVFWYASYVKKKVEEHKKVI
ncbi:helix-turn-helix transcriptional regulator [Acinetobacter beijerinckii]|uniref:Uncharacterized protein n=1 Tax=Acinetobacter beijerinckii CIP 110307 TaxID=1217648 RepID=N9FHW4_9GAMM|nr:hypothetical protein F933_02662 [Acinetobacter beijerinckii CIP 110307]